MANEGSGEIDYAINSIVIFGTGHVGAGLALACALKAVTVSLVSTDSAGLVDARTWMRDFFDRAVQQGKFQQSEVFHILGRMCFALGYERVSSADLIVECVEGDSEEKKAVFTKIRDMIKPTAIGATSSPIESIRELGEAFGAPERFLGAHFFTPVPVNKLVEVVVPPETSREAMEAVMDFAIKIGKTPVMCKDKPGFLVNRLLVPFMLNAMRLYQEGNAPEDVDAAIELGLGHKIGPLKLADSMGLDVVHKMAQLLFDYYGNEEYKPPKVLSQHIERGRLGKKSKRGFYRY